jgi:hypothetical protein
LSQAEINSRLCTKFVWEAAAKAAKVSGFPTAAAWLRWQNKNGFPVDKWPTGEPDLNDLGDRTFDTDLLLPSDILANPSYIPEMVSEPQHSSGATTAESVTETD